MNRYIKSLPEWISESRHFLKWDSYRDMENRKDRMDPSQPSDGREAVSDGRIRDYISDLPREIRRALKLSTDWLNLKGATWRIKEYWTPYTGWFCQLETGWDPTAWSTLSNIWEGIDNRTVVPFLREFEDLIEIRLIDPEKWEDLISL